MGERNNDRDNMMTEIYQKPLYTERMLMEQQENNINNIPLVENE